TASFQTDLSGIWVRTEFGSVSVPVLECSACFDLKFIVASLAPNVTLQVIAAAFAAPLAVQESDFPGVIYLIQWRTNHLARQIFSITGKVFRSRIRSGSYVPRRHRTDIARSQICHGKQSQRCHSDLSQRGFTRQLRSVRPSLQWSVVK